MSEESEAKNLRESRLKHVASMVASAVALVTAISALAKPEDQSVNKESYETLTAAIKQLSEQTQKNHDDLVALRGYTEAAVQFASVPMPSAADAGAGPAPTTVIRIRRPPAPASSASLSSFHHDAGTFVALAVGDEAPEPPPPLHDPPGRVEPPSFEKVQKAAASKK
jgi:hypothetical protein